MRLNNFNLLFVPSETDAYMREFFVGEFQALIFEFTSEPAWASMNSL